VEYTVKEEIEIILDGEYIFDIFLLPDFLDEDELWEETENELQVETENPSKLSYYVAGLLFLFALYRIIKARRKYGPLKVFRKRIKEESKKTVEEHKQDLEQEEEV